MRSNPVFLSGMKTKILAMASLLTAVGATYAAEGVDVGQLPSAVKQALGASARGERVKKVTIQNVDGRNVYDIELERENAPNPRLRIADDGQILRDIAPAAAASDVPVIIPEYISSESALMPRLRLEELPQPARETIEKQAAGREIAAIHEDTIDGQKAYAAQFRERGRNPWVYVAKDGGVLRPTEKPPALIVGPRLSETPTAVQETIKREIGTGEITKVDKQGQRSEPTIYKVEIRDARGTYEIRVAEDGRILENTRPAERPPNRG
jgi:uncharacterized membrane protein YkoI